MSITERSTENCRASTVLAEVATLLESQGADHDRVQAFRAAAESIASAPVSIRTLLAKRGRAGLQELPHIEPRISAALDEFERTGHLRLFDRLRGEFAAERLLQTVPGVGPQLSEAIHELLGIHTLEELEMAAHDGRLARLDGFGPRRVAAIRHELASMLSNRSWLRDSHKTGARPDASIELLLSIDRDYRHRVEADTLPKIAPRRFNSSGKPWLPIWHSTRDGWELTAMFSNTARAHRLARTRDWVVIFYERFGRERQCTIVTEHRSLLRGRRVVRGREHDCASYYGTTGISKLVEPAMRDPPATAEVPAPRDRPDDPAPERGASI